MLARVTLLALSVLLLAGAGVAQAHDVQVEQPGSIELDLASGEREVLVHGTLVKAGDTARITFAAPKGVDTIVQLLVPDRQPERAAEDGELPTLVIGANDVGTPFTGAPETKLRDNGTGTDYLELYALPLTGDGTTRTATVTRGTEPIRIAVRVAAVDSDAGFETLDPERTPRTMARLLQWDNTPAPGASVRRAATPERRSYTSPEVWLPVGIAASMLVTAIWWVRRGRGRARVRGFERRSEEQELP